MIPTDLEGKILRLYQAERWSVGAIATEVGVHHSTVSRVLHSAGMPRPTSTRPSKLDPYEGFMRQQLDKHPKITAACLFEMTRQRGYSGSPSHFRRVVARLRPRKPAEAFMRLRTLKGEQAQVDWAHMGTVAVGRATRPLMAFVMVLSWSRHIFVRFSLDQRMGSFLRGHAGAFDFFGGVPRVALYDNLKSAVTSRRGQAIQFNETLLAFANHHRYEPRPVAPYRGNEKGRVERAIRYLRSSFFTGRDTRNLDNLNAQALIWCREIAGERRCPEDDTQSVIEAWREEREVLMELPDDAFPTWDQAEVKVGKTPYVRFDLNDYSVPHDRVRRGLQVLADHHRVRIMEAGEQLAEHPRSWSRGEQIEDPSHIEALVQFKREGREARGKDRLTHAAPRAQELLREAGLRGHNVGAATASLLRLLDTYGQAELASAVGEALDKDSPHPHAVRQILEARREATGQVPKLAIDVPERARRLAVTDHELGSYDDGGL